MEGPSSLEQYEQRLYAAWSAFEGGSGGLTRPAALALCDALQLEQRGAQLVDELFARTNCVSFSQFRGGLLAVLGATGGSNSSCTDSRVSPQPQHSDDSSSGREVAPRLTVGAKRYGRRSRPARAVPATVSSPPVPAAPAALRHDTQVDAPRALELCHSLRMEGVDRALVESIFEATPNAAGTTVGEFFDRLNAELGSMAGVSGEETLPADVVLEAWEHNGVQRPRQLLLELGFGGTSVPAPALEAALDRELEALSDPEARALVLQAALSLSRMRTARALHAADAVAGERARLAQDVAESERRARRVAMEADEQQARLESELRAVARRSDQRHADTVRHAEGELATERERAHTERVALQTECTRRMEAESKLRAEVSACTERAEALEARCAAAEQRVAELEWERARLLERCAASEATPSLAAPDEALEAALHQLRADNLALRDRCDELQTQLDAPPVRAAVTMPPATPLSAEAASLDAMEQRIEECGALPGATPPPSTPTDAVAAAPHSPSTPTDAVAAAPHSPSTHTDAVAAAPHSPSTPTDAVAAAPHSPSTPTDAVAAAPHSPSTPTDAVAAAPHSPSTHTEAVAAAVQAAETKHAAEREKLTNVIRDLESAVAAMHEEYERCEDYWEGKLQEERQLQANEQQATNQRLKDLLTTVQEYEQRFARTLPAIPEAAEDLEQELVTLKQQHADHIARKDEELRRREHQLRQARHRLRLALSAAETATADACGGADGAGGLRMRLRRAEECVTRLMGRLVAADMLVKQLYVENCLLTPTR